MLQIHQSGFTHAINTKTRFKPGFLMKSLSFLFLLCGQFILFSASNVEANEVNNFTATVEKQLDAGEFSKAIETAMSVKDSQEKSRLLKTIANAQRETGDFATSLASIRRIPDTAIKSKEHRSHVKEKASLAGGGSAGAAIQELVELIQAVTGDEDTWADDEEAGGTIIEWSTTANTGHFKRKRKTSGEFK